MAVLAEVPCPSLPQNEHAPWSVLVGVVVRGRRAIGLGVALGVALGGALGVPLGLVSLCSFL